MSHYECATVSFGFKIQMKKLIDQITEDNFDVVKNLLSEGFIEDSNGYANNYYKYILDGELPSKCSKFKKFIKEKLDNNNELSGSDSNSESDSESDTGSESDVRKQAKKFNGNINNMYLLIPLVKMLETTRWGTNRKGINSKSCEIDYDLEKIKKSVTDDYEHVLKDYQIVLMVNQESD
jgi:hypothetical protein